jgi:hypothetical protein
MPRIPARLALLNLITLTALAATLAGCEDDMLDAYEGLPARAMPLGTRITVADPLILPANKRDGVTVCAYGSCTSFESRDAYVPSVDSVRVANFVRTPGSTRAKGSEEYDMAYTFSPRCVITSQGFEKLQLIPAGSWLEVTKVTPDTNPDGNLVDLEVRPVNDSKTDPARALKVSCFGYRQALTPFLRQWDTWPDGSRTHDDGAAAKPARNVNSPVLVRDVLKALGDVIEFTSREKQEATPFFPTR